ncbi:MAG: helicase-related protein, partial [Muribaculaceae bacterium]
RDELDGMLSEHNGEVIEQSPVIETAESVPETSESVETEQPQLSATERIPKDEQGQPIYEKAETPDIAWDAIVERTEGDEVMAQTVADGMVADKEAALKKIVKAKSKGGTTIEEKIVAEKERKVAIEVATAQLDIWKRISQTSQSRKVAEQSELSRIASEKAAELKAEQEKLRVEQEESERIEREALNGVPDIVDDTPQDARARGYRRVSGHKVDRQEPIQSLQGKEVSVKFGNDAISNGRVTVIEAEELQPSHLQGERNHAHFIDEAQPKERNDEASVLSARKIASDIRPEEITSSVTAYTGAPTVNARGEVIQGNSRSDALREMWNSNKEQSAKYKEYLKAHADEFGLSGADIDGMKRPVLVNMLEVSDEEAIQLGQYVAQDTESGGIERIKPKNALQRMGADIRSFSNLLLKSADNETSFAGLVDNNGVEVLKWMSMKGYITPTQYRSAFDTKDNLTAEVKNDLKGILYQSIFKGGSTRLEEMFNAMPAKAQRAILATAYRDYDSPNAERMVDEIQNSLRAYNALSANAQFSDAKTFKEARFAVESWKRQYQIDDVSGESYLPAENFSNFALHLATMYKGENQSFIQSTFNQLYDLIQGVQEKNLFEQPNKTPRTLAQAIYETLKIEYDGQQRSNVLVGDTSTSQQREQGSNGSLAPGERVEDGNESADRTGGTERGSGQSEITSNTKDDAKQGAETTIERTDDSGVEATTDNSGRVADDTTEETPRISNRGDIRVFEEGLGTSYGEHSEYSERNRREAESERLVNVAKQNGQFIPNSETKELGVVISKRTGESTVYIDKEKGKVYKVKAPYAKAALKNGVQPEDVIYEHTIHNLLFPETEYTFEGISEDLGDARIVLSQNLIQSFGQPTKEQIAEALAQKGLYLEDNYSFGNELVSVTDVEGDNVLLGENGTIYFIDPIIKFKRPAKEIIESLSNTQQETLGKKLEAAEAETNTTPTEAQKEAGNYKKGHVKVGTFDITVENPKGSERSGTDANGNKWSVTMHNTYGYIRSTEGVDGDHIDVFISDDIDGWNGHQVFVVDQYNEDGTFDEHKVMLGFNSIEDANDAYYSNYSSDWKEKHQSNRITDVSIEDFAKWINSSKRKTKPFSEYKIAKSDNGETKLSDQEEDLFQKAERISKGEEKPKNEGVLGLVSDKRMTELKERLRKKLGGQLNVGLDPEILAIGMELAAGHIDRGVKKFADFAKVMVDDLGDVIRPYVKAFYNGVRDLPEIIDNGLSAELTPYDEVRVFDIEREENTHKRNKSKKNNVSSQQKSTDLFSEILIENKKEDGLQGNDGVRSKGLSADNNRRSTGRGGENDIEEIRKESGRTERGGESRVERISQGIQPSNGRPTGRLQGLNTNNNHSDRGQDHAPISNDARIEANIKAIELSQRLIGSGEKATPQQMSLLRKFSGWGGLGKAFSVNAPWHTLPDGRNSNENETRQRLQELLGLEAYQQAVMSANSAYYTPSYVVDTLWDIAKQMGFDGGNVLEGSAGIGNVLGQMPTDVSDRSNIQAIEIDGTSGGILSLLYPDAKVDIQGFEQTRIPNGSIDLAITNVPFVTGLRVNDTTGDSDLSKKFHNIHDFCISKNIRKLRDGGIGIFITSNGTLDNSKKLRDWIVSDGCSDFVGAFRMNNKTFGGTGVTSDIIVVRKRVNGKKSTNAIDVIDISGERSAEYSTGETRKVKGQDVPIVKQLSMDYNKYFIEHPENMAGEMHFAFEQGDTFRPTSKGLYPTKGKNQEQMLSDFVNSFKEDEFSDKGNNTNRDVSEVMPDKKIGEMFIRDGKLCVNSTASAQVLTVNDNKVKGHTKVECFNAYFTIKQALKEVLSYQTNNESDNGLEPLLANLNKAYDSFVETYGHFNKNTSISFLRNDVDYPNVFSLETLAVTLDENGKRVHSFGKTDVFKRRVVENEKEPTPTNVKDGIVASVFKFGRIDVPYIAQQIGKSEQEVKSKIISDKLGFEDPTTKQMELSFQYLSGNIREKLRQAQDNNDNGYYDSNIKSLQDIIPMDIPAHLIDFTLGSSWIDPKLYNEYTKERTDIDVKFTSIGGTWFMSAPEYGLNKEKNRSIGVSSEKFHKQIMGHTLIEAAIQNKSISVSETRKKYDGTTETITDKEATQACATKIDEIRQDFKEWARQKMQSDSEISAQMERIYNDTFNNYVPLSIPDEYAPKYFGGASHKFNMYQHQSKAIVRGTMQSLLLAHEVGTGKTFTLISTAMEMRRLGTARKPMIVVQNATVGQFVASAKELYPNAKILTLEDSDRTAEGRKNFYAKIRYNDWDMIVVPQSTFEFIPDSEERQMAFVQDKIEEKMIVLEKMEEADPHGNDIITRQAAKEIADLEVQLASISDDASKKRTASEEKKQAVTMQNAEVQAFEMLDRRTDDVENFDEMGIDALLIDEAHEYKHLGFATAMQRGVKGVDSSYSKKSQGVYLKTQSIIEKNNGRNVIFATGTPISNTAAEIWTFMRYLMPSDTMKGYGIYYFDDFVRNFGNIQQMMEFTASGKFKEQNRFAGYINLPELIRIWSGVSDTVLTKEAEGVNNKIPEIEGGKAQDLYLPQTKALRGIMKYVKAQLEAYEKMSGKAKKENSHIPLVMYGLAKAAAVDARLVDADAEDDKNSKTNEAVRQTLRTLQETSKYKGTVAIFADNYQNKHSGFNLYDDIREKLIAEGIPADEVVVIKSGMSVKKKLDIFDKVNNGEIRVVMGSTFTLGTGVNIQERLHTVIHLDAPNRPMDYTQRNGRILRQGNLHKSMSKAVRVLRFGVEDSLDVTAYQRLKTKGAIADSIMNGKHMMQNSMVNRVLEEEEDVFGDTVAQLSGSEYAMLKNNAEKNVRKYESRKKQWEADQTYIYNAKPKLKGQIATAEKRAEEQRKYLQELEKAFADEKSKELIVGKQSFATVDDMTDFVKDYNKKILDSVKEMKDSGSNGEQKRELTVSVGGYDFNVKTVMSKEIARGGGQLFSEIHRIMTYSCSKLGLVEVPVRQALLRNALVDITENVITGKDFAERAESSERSAKYNQSELEQVLSRDGKPFEYDKELEQSKKQYIEYAELMKKEMEDKEAKYSEMD